MNNKINESALTTNAQNKAQQQPDGNVVFVKPHGNGWKVFSIEPALYEIAQAQGVLTDAKRVVFGK